MDFFVPVLRDVAHRSPEDLRAGLNRMRRDIKTRRIPCGIDWCNTDPVQLWHSGGTLRHACGRPPTSRDHQRGVIREEVVAWKGKPAVHRCCLCPLPLITVLQRAEKPHDFSMP